MPRPCKSANLLSDSSQTKDEIAVRTAAEDALRGGNDKLLPPAYLSPEQRDIFLYIQEELLTSGILGNLDVFVLAQCAVAIDRMQYIDEQINENFDLLRDNRLMATREKYTKSFYRCCNELSLSPQARAKMANINLNGKTREADPVMQLLEAKKAAAAGEAERTGDGD